MIGSLLRRRSRFRVLLVSALLLGLLGAPARALMTPAEEARMGKEILKKIQSQLPLVHDPQIVQYVNKVGHRIVQHIGYHDYPYRFFVINNGSLNAFAIPGGYIFIYRGLLEIMGGESELAAVLSHEIAHVQARHIARRIEQTTPLNIATFAGALLAILAGGGKAAGAIMMGASAANLSYQLKFSRENEEEADRLGMKFLVASGYDVRGMVSVFKKMLHRQYVNVEQIATYLSTHPGLNERIVYMENMVNTHQYPIHTARERASRKEFLKAKVRLIALYDNPNQGINKLKALAKQEGGAIPYYGMGLLFERARRIHQAMEAYRRAVELDPTNAEFVKQLGVACYSTGDCGQASKYLARALQLDPQDPGALMYTGRIQLDTGRYGEAQRTFERLRKISPDDAEVYRYLGLAYGRDGKLVRAHEYYGVYFARSGDRKNALYHFKKALDLARMQDPGRVKEIRERIDRLQPKGKSGKKRSGSFPGGNSPFWNGIRGGETEFPVGRMLV